MSPNPPQIDTTIEVIAPENIAFTYRVAGPFRRFPAYLLDFLIRVGVLIALGLLMGLLAPAIGGSGGGCVLAGLFVLSWFYGGLFEAYWNGQTPGKRVMGLRVLSTNGRPIDGFQAVLRNLLRTVDISFMGLRVCSDGL